MNEYPDVAQNAEDRIGELLLRGMERNALIDLNCEEPWKRRKAQLTLANIGLAHSAALPKWLNRLLADTKNTKKDFKLLRAHRRGILHYDRPAGWGYPSNWKEVASRIRRLDNYQCVSCAITDEVIDVHHIVYVSSFGTHQQSNLVSLCRTCHEAEHKRRFDFGETEAENGPEVDEVKAVVRIEPAVPATSPRAPESLARPLAKESINALQPVSATEQEPITSEIVVKPNEPEQGKTVSLGLQRFCGHCRTLVVPRRRFLWIKVCPNCACSI